VQAEAYAGDHVVGDIRGAVATLETRDYQLELVILPECRSSRTEARRPSGRLRRPRSSDGGPAAQLPVHLKWCMK